VIRSSSWVADMVRLREREKCEVIPNGAYRQRLTHFSPDRSGHSICPLSASPADWRPRIRCSLVINLAIRRRCHEHIGGFFDYHLFRRDGCDLVPNYDLFTGIEDVFYNRLVDRFCKGLRTTRETVEYLRHPGNSYDRQYSRFQVPPGEYREVVPPEYRLRVELCEALFRYTVEKLLRETHPVGPPLAADLSPSPMR
jgi:hypothetical protein